VEEATKKALAQLNAGSDEIEITVISEGKNGILGLGAEDARISVRLRQPEKEAFPAALETARTVLENLLSKMDVQADVVPGNIEISTGKEEISQFVLNIAGEDLSYLIGRRGQTLDALQYLVRLITSRLTNSRAPILVDVENYKQQHYEDLKTLALNVAEQVKSRHSSIRLEPMPPFERRIIHLTLAGDDQVATESVGEGDFRKVIVSPK
jgi:spoIIIJ-associated protein